LSSKRKNDKSHIRKIITIQKDIYDKFREVYPDVNLSLFVELCIQDALKLKGVNILLEEDKILLGKAKTTVDRLEKILKSKELVERLRTHMHINNAKKYADLYKKQSLQNKDTE